MDKICVICGKEFEPHGSAITCGKECSIINKKIKKRKRNKLYKERQRIIRRINTSNNTCIVEMNKKARELGMSYGQYSAMLMMRKENKANGI